MSISIPISPIIIIISIIEFSFVCSIVFVLFCILVLIQFVLSIFRVCLYVCVCVCICDVGVLNALFRSNI